MKRKKRIIFIIIFLDIIFFLFGIAIANKNNEKKFDNNYILIEQKDNIKIFVNSEYNEKNYKKYLYELKDIPEVLKNNCESIYFTNENLNKKFNLEISTTIVAISYGNDIYVNTTYYGKNVITHEMFHVYDYSNGWISKEEKFQKIYEKYKLSIKMSPGNNENEYEFFATCGEEFLSNSENNKNTEIHNYFSNLINKN